MMIEEWKPIKGFEGMYEISSFGRIKSLKRTKVRSERILKGSVTSHGYRHIDLNKSGHNMLRLNRLVAKHFVPNPDNKPFVNHKDGDKLNDRADNLEWCTQSENESHAHKTGLKNFSRDNCKMKKITYQKAQEIRTAYNLGTLQRDLAIKYGITQPNISSIVNNKAWK